ncbi:hypothetical protein BKA70DRAFT_1412005 [Coprinopsis sp. MPI-PUGE-AT-0042]|nr:hypothetical protein BKA70DRAFT_1412005 [Coprinopsis sp. MPI-PUGE-AT-0042]
MTDGVPQPGSVDSRFYNPARAIHLPELFIFLISAVLVSGDTTDSELKAQPYGRAPFDIPRAVSGIGVWVVVQPLQQCGGKDYKGPTVLCTEKNNLVIQIFRGIAQSLDNGRPNIQESFKGNFATTAKVGVSKFDDQEERTRFDKTFLERISTERSRVYLDPLPSVGKEH